MFKPIKVIDVELSRPLPNLEGLERYETLQALVRLHGIPFGYVYLPLSEGRGDAVALSQIIVDKYSGEIVRHLINCGLAAQPYPEALQIEDLVEFQPPVYPGPFPLVTVVVCTRDRPADLRICLDALSQLDYPNLEILVIDNAPTNDSAESLVREQYPNIRYICEKRPGLSWARNRSIVEAKGEIIAWTDDDVIVDPGWVTALVKVYNEEPEVMAVNGLVVPYELETEPQILFERHGGFGRGFKRKSWQVQDNKVSWHLLGAGQYGTGANMSLRRSVFSHIGNFNVALGAGTVTNGCEDLEMFFRVVKEGFGLVYEPSALVRHRHRREYAQLRSQLANDGIGLYSYFTWGVTNNPQQRFSFLRLALWWFIYGNLIPLWVSLKHPTRFPRDLVLAELRGCFSGLTRYQKACKIAAEIENSFGALPPLTPVAEAIAPSTLAKRPGAIAVRTIDLSQPLQGLLDAKDYSNIRLFVKWKHRMLGSLDIANPYQEITETRLRQAIVDGLATKVLAPDSDLSQNFLWAKTVATLTKHYSPIEPAVVPNKLPISIPVSIVVGTRDRPDDLRNCLYCLVTQDSPRQVEIIVVDNNPASGLTAPVVAEFPEVILVDEPRQGVAYARNAGIKASIGDIVVATDDDVTHPQDWLETLLAPFVRADIAIVTGNILPQKLETPAQRLFESYGGLGRGFRSFEVNGDWMESYPKEAAPTWSLGGTANAAFRATIFNHPEIGLMDEALGPGMPSGVGEDTYLFYKTIKAGYTAFYEPKACVWHKHRQSMPELRHQIYNYSKGHVAYHLTTWLQDRDWRGIWQILIVLPRYHAYRIKERLMGPSDYSIPMVLLEIAGNLAGPWSLWRSRQRVKREGRSEPYIPVSERPVALEEMSVNIPQYATSESHQA